MFYSLIILLPFLSFISGSLFGSLLGIGVTYITISSIFISFIISLTLFFDILQYNSVYKLTLGNWISSEYLN